MVERIKEQVEAENFRFTIHGFERCVERHISPNEVRYAMLSGEVIEDYPEDKYGPSCLIYCLTKAGRILHVHCSIEPVWVITAYDPTLNPDEWEADFKRRTKRS
jgi:hypothetical protein